jgi:hypothetical protein
MATSLRLLPDVDSVLIMPDTKPGINLHVAYIPAYVNAAYAVGMLRHVLYSTLDPYG